MGDEYIPPTEVDEKYLLEWFEHGYKNLGSYLTKQARFEDWCRRHPKEEHDEQDSSEGKG